MAKPKDPSRKKGTFGSIRLPVATEYLVPSSRRTMMMIGGIGSAAILLYFLVNAFFFSDTFSSPGDLSSNHANFEPECSKCHKSVAGVQAQRCSTCHEKTNDELGVYTYPAHYLYRSENPARIDSVRLTHADEETACANCHPEHRGNRAEITVVPDEKCTACHDYGSFNKRHPEFEFARQHRSDDSTLIFTHIRHTKFVKEDIEKRTGSTYIEKACLYCHNPQPDGKSFMPPDFDTHCGDCHLTAATDTPRLDIRDAGDPTVPGVETLEMIQRRRGPGTMWAFYTNPDEFSESGGKVKKSPIYHRDPWIMENLKQLRQMAFGDQGLAGLLMARKVGGSKSKPVMYAEAISTLRQYAAELRSRPEPEIRRELFTIDSLLRIAQRRVSTPGTALPDPMVLRSVSSPGINPSQRQEFAEFSQKLTRPCLVCHVVQDADILGVKSSQRTFQRAEFNHRAHLFERRCLECHTEIPVEQALLRADTTGVAAKDRASTQNVPPLANCLECHSPTMASSTCVTCHFMHPNKENRGILQLAVETN